MTRLHLAGLTALAALALSGGAPDPSDGVQVMVRDAPGLDEQVAAAGSFVVRHTHSTAFVGVGVPAGHTPESFSAALRALGHHDATPIARMSGAGKPSGKGKGPIASPASSSQQMTSAQQTQTVSHVQASTAEVQLSPSFDSYQWHLDELDLRGRNHRADGVVVAVIDSGVAYTDAVEDGQTFRAASSLAGVPIVAPWDFVEDDALPLDEHQHGTHIASLIASEGLVRGVAPGVHLMPLRVLDHNNAGNELDLVDAIHWAVDNGAQVINLSLSFPTGYLPSVALEEALERAHAQGVVVVAATGNDGANIISWPAASPTTLAVSGTAPYSDGVQVAPYANRDPRVSLMAPGGDLLVDTLGDGFPDGLLAETIALRDPSQPGLWFMEGTSQAAALASGAAALLVARGYAASDVPSQLQYTSRPDFGPHVRSASAGMGAGSLDPHRALLVGDMTRQNDWMPDYTVAVLPYLERRSDGGVVPHARLTLLADGQVATSGQIHGSFWGSTESFFTCAVTGRLQDDAYHCDVSGPAVPDGQDDAAWLVSADLVTGGSGIQRPTAAAFGSTELDVLIAAMHNDPEIGGGVLGFMWQETDTEEYGPVAEGYTISDLGSGLLSSPMGLLARPRAITAPTSYSLDLDGSGLLSSPMGFQSVRILSFSTFSGSGLLSSPMGFFRLPKLVFIDGSGLLSSPMGFSASTLLAADTTYTRSSWSLYSGSSVDGTQTLGDDSWAHGPSLLISTDAVRVDDAQSGAAHLPGVPFIP